MCIRTVGEMVSLYSFSQTSLVGVLFSFCSRSSHLQSPSLIRKLLAMSTFTGTLTVQVVRGIDLRDVETFGKQDPFVTLSIGSDKQKTKTIDGTLSFTFV
jgi:C2 domain